MKSQLGVLLTIAGLLFAASIRWTIATGDSLWLDELHTAWVASNGLAEVAGRAADGNQNPLFFWLTWFSVALLGQNEIALRCVSLLAGLGLLMGAGWLTWRGSRSLIGVGITAALITLDWRFVFYGTEARPYALMQMLGLLHAGLFAHLAGWLPSLNSDAPNNDSTTSWLFGRARLRPSCADEQATSKKQLGRSLALPTDYCEATAKSAGSRSMRWSILTLLSIALFYCHITSVWVFAVEIAALSVSFLMAQNTRRPAQSDGARVPKQPAATPTHKLVKPLLLSGVATIAGCLPGVLTLNLVFGRRSNWSGLSSPASVWADVQEPLLFWMALPLLIFVVGWIANKTLSRSQLDGRQNTRRAELSLFVLLWAITPIAGVIVAHHLGVAPLALFRYTVIGTPAMAIFAGLMIGNTRGPWLKVIAVAAIAWSSYGYNEITRQLVDRQTLPVLRHEDWDTPSSAIRGVSDKDYEPVLLFANVIEDADALSNLDPRFQDYLRFPAASIHDTNGFGRQVFACPTHGSPRLSGELIKLIAQMKGGWLLIRGSDATVQSIVNEVENSLSDHLLGDSDRTFSIQERNDDGDVVHLFSVDLR